MQFRFALAVALIPTISGFAFADDSFTVDEFRRIHTEIVPPTELWKSIPWQTDLIQAQQQAAEQHKLIFIWAMDGHPLGCT